MTLRMIWQMLKATVQGFIADNAFRLAAALSFYTALSVAPLLVLLVTLIGWLLGARGAQAEVVSQIWQVAGAQAAEVAEVVLLSADRPDLARAAGVVSLAILLWGASNVFAELQQSLNLIWGVELKSTVGMVALLRDRLLSFGMILVIGFLLLVSLVLSTLLTAVSGYLGGLFPGIDPVWQVINFLVSLSGVTLLFALIYRVLPDARIAWRDLWMGAAVTAVLFNLGKYLLSLYLSFETTSSAYGAAGSLMVFLIWVYYSAQIFFLGAEFTQVYARHYGRGIRPNDQAHVIVKDPPEASETTNRG